MKTFTTLRYVVCLLALIAWTGVPGTVYVHAKDAPTYEPTDHDETTHTAAQDEPTPTNVALNKPVAVDSERGSSFRAENAVDGLRGPSSSHPRWLSDSNGYPHWIAVGLGNDYLISEVKFYMGASGAYKRPVGHYQIQIWDDTVGDWVVVLDRTGNADPTPEVVIEPAVIADSVRLLGLAGSPGDEGIMRMFEFEVYGVPADGNLTPVAEFVATPPSGIAPLSVDFDASASLDIDGSIVSYDWAFGDGATATGVITSHVFTLPGDYDVTLTVTDDVGAAASTSQVITVTAQNTAPVAVISADPASGPVPLTINFDASGSTDTENNISSYEWAFGDNSAGSGQQATHEYIEVGSYEVVLTVTDTEGLWDTDTITVTVLPSTMGENVALGKPVKASSTLSPNVAPRAVDGNIGTSNNTRWVSANRPGPHYIDISLQGNYVINQLRFWTGSNGYKDGVNYFLLGWNGVSYDTLVDGGSNRASIVDVHFTPYETDSVRLVGIGVNDNYFRLYEVEVYGVPGSDNARPKAAFTADVTSGLPPLTVNFDASSSSDTDGNIENYAWDFGDDNTATGVAATHVFQDPGTYTVLLVVTDNEGSRASQTMEIVIEDPNAPFNVALGKPVTADSERSSTHKAENAVDGDIGPNNDTRWLSADTPGEHYIEVDLQGYFSLDQLKFWTGASGYNRPVRYLFLGWNGVDYDTLVNGLSNNNAIVDESFAAYVTDKVRLVGTGRDDNIFRLYEIEVYGRPFEGNLQPTAFFALDKLYAPPPRTVDFDGTLSMDRDGTIVSYDWDFGDGTSGSGPMVTHTYTETGFFNATLTVTDNEGLTGTRTVEVATQNRPPIVNFSASRKNGFAPLIVNFDASATIDPDGDLANASFVWDFGDGTTASGVKISHIFALDTFKVTLTVTDEVGDTSSQQQTIETMPLEEDGKLLPVEDAYVREGLYQETNYGDEEIIELQAHSQAQFRRRGYLKFDLAGFSGITSAKLRYFVVSEGAATVKNVNDDQWTEETITSINAPGFSDCDACSRIQNGGNGEYEIVDVTGIAQEQASGDGILSLGLAGGGSSTTSISTKERQEFIYRPVLIIKAENKAFPPIADFTVSSLEATPPATIEFDASGSLDYDGSISSYFWDFGDGVTATGIQVSHEYTTTGTFTAVLTVTDDSGRTGVAQTKINMINQLPVAAFSIDNLSGEAPLPVTFDAAFDPADSTGSYDRDANGSLVLYIWEYGDGSPIDTLASPQTTHVYAANGVYTAQLTVVDNLGGFSKATGQVAVRQPGAIVLFPEADAFVRKGSASENNNYGSNTSFGVWNRGSGSTEESFVRFDLGSLAGQAVNSAKIRLHARRIGFVIDIHNQVAKVPDDSWAEDEITWANKPAAEAAVVAEWKPMTFNRRVIEFDVTDLVNAELSTDGKLSLRLFSPTSSGGFTKVDYWSRENGEGLSPELIINGAEPLDYGSKLLFTGDFEVSTQANTNLATDFSGWKQDLTIRSQPFDSEIVGQPTRNGRYSFKSRMLYKRVGGNENIRNEVEVNNYAAVGDERWMGYSIYIPEDYPIHRKFQIVAQGHGQPDPGENFRSPFLSHEMRDDIWRLFLRSDAKPNSNTGGITTEARWTAPFKVGEWTDFVIYQKFSFENDGVFVLWVDDNPVPALQHYGPNCYNDQGDFYWKQGIYKPDYDLVDPGEIIIYHDETRIGDGSVTYGDVSPSGTNLLRPAQPTVSFTLDKTTGMAPLEVNFDASASAAASGRNIVSYIWDFGDGTMDTTSAPITSHTYVKAGKREVTLKVVDDINTAAFATSKLDVAIPPGNELVIAANADAYLRGGSFSAAINRDTNYGRTSRLETAERGGPKNSNTRRFLVRWDLPAIPNIYSAKARFYVNRVGPILTLTNRIRLVEDIEWHEDSITWNSYDATSKTVSDIADIEPHAYSNGIVEVDLTDVVIDQVGKGNTELTLMVISPKNLGGNGITYYYSKEGGFAPELVLNEGPVEDTENLLFVGDFEVPDPGASIGTDFTGWNREFPATPGQLVTAPSRDGGSSYKATLNKSELNIRQRSEVLVFKYGRVGDQRYVGWSTFLPQDWKDHNDFTVAMQVHGQPDNNEVDRSPMAFMEVRNKKLRFGVRTDPNRISQPASTGSGGTIQTRILWEGPYVKGEWMDFVMFQKLSYNDDGETRLWYNGDQVVDDTGPNSYNDGGDFYIKYGIYKPGYNNSTTYIDENGNAVSLEGVVTYTDQVKIGNGFSGFERVSPSGVPNNRLAPVAEFSYSPEVFAQGDTVYFDASASRAFDGGDIVTYTWDFGDESPAEQTSEPTISHVFPGAGFYDVRLKVEDSFGGSSEFKADVIGTDNPNAGEILFAVGDALSLNASDLAVRRRMQVLGYQVVVRSDTELTTDSARNYDLVVISSTINPNDILTKFKDVAVPVFVWDNGVYDDMALSDLAKGSDTNERDLVISNPGHPLAAGLTGTVSVTSAPTTFTYGNPFKAANTVAHLKGAPARAGIFYYEAGDSLYTGIALAKRVGFFLNDNTAALLSPEGEQLLEAAVNWSATTVPGTPQAIIEPGVLEGPAPLNVTFDGGNSTDDGTIERYDWDFGDGSILATGVSANHTFENPGLYTVVLKVTDDTGLFDYETFRIKVTGTLITDVATTNGDVYEVDILGTGVTYHTDRSYQVRVLPDTLPAGTEFIRTANDGLKRSKADTLFTFNLTEPAYVYVAYDPRGNVLPSWMSDYTAIDATVETSDSGTDLALYSKLYPAGLVAIGGNLQPPAVGAQTGFFVAASTSGVSNLPPVVTVTSPGPDEPYLVCQQVLFEASATDPDGNIDEVRFYVNDQLVGSDTGNVASFAWSPGTGDVFTLSVVAVDDLGQESESQEVIFTVLPDTEPPILEAPADIFGVTDPGTTTVSLTLEAPAATDTCQVTVTGSRSDGLALADPFPVGQTLVTWLAEDFSGNRDSVAQVITVEDYIVSITSLAVESKTANQPRPTDNQIHNFLRLVNTGENEVPYEELSVRYWFTAEEFAPINSWCDYAQIGANTINASVVAADPIRSGGHYYLQLDFESTQVLAGGANSGPIQTRWAKNDWTPFDEGDDFSYLPVNSYTENPTITVYRNGTLVWGTEPGVEAPLTQVAVTYRPGDANSPNDNQLKPHLDVFNQGNTSLDFEDLKVRYWFTSEGEADINVWKDYIAMGSNRVQAQVYSMDTPVAGADHYLELTFDANAGIFYALSSTGKMQLRLAKSDWSSFHELDDHSYISSSAFVLNPNITVYLQDTLVWGTEPGGSSNARLASDPLASEGDLQIERGLSVYPNPAYDLVHLAIGLEETGVVEISITDTNGRQVEYREERLDAGLQVLEINTTAYPAGFYLVGLRMKDYYEQKKLMIH